MTRETREQERAQRVRSPENPWGLGPMPTKAENAARKRRLVKAARTAAVAIDRVEQVRLANLRPDGPAVLPPLRWWGEEP